MARVTIKRSKQLSDKLKALRVATQKPVRAALGAAAQDMVEMMRRLAPDGPGAGEYDLKGTIDWHFGAAEGGGSDAVSGRSVATRATITAGDAKNPEARWMEFGTPPHENEGKFAGTENPGVRARPYFFPSYRALKKQAKAKVQRAITKAVKEVASR